MKKSAFLFLVSQLLVMLAAAQNTTFSLQITKSVTCFGGQDGAAVVQNMMGGTAPYRFLWSNGDTNAIVSHLEAAQYFVTVTDATGKRTVDSLLLTAPPAILFDLTIQNPSCAGYSDGTIVVKSIQNAAFPCQYILNNELKETKDSIFLGQSSSAFNLKVKDARGCVGEKDSLVDYPRQFLIYIGDDTLVRLGDFVQLRPKGSFPIATFQWKNADGSPFFLDTIQPVIYLNQTTEIFLTACNSNGCCNDDAIRIFVDRRSGLFVPNAFSPNGDGNNDDFRAYYDNSVTGILKLFVFDRWGNMVFQQTTDSAKDIFWDGTTGGQAAPTGVYAYRMEYLRADGSSQYLTGDVTLVK